MATTRPSLRERKFARTKLALLNAAVEAMAHQRLEEIPVKTLCEAADLSEATFFNYFPRKSHLLDYFLQLWTLELSWHHSHGPERGLARLEACFGRIGKQFQEHHPVMMEIVARQALSRERRELPAIGVAERLRAFPRLDGIEEQPLLALDRMWAQALEEAVGAGELPPNLHLPGAIAGLASLFYGVPLALGRNGAARIASHYRQQLILFLTGLRTASDR